MANITPQGYGLGYVRDSFDHRDHLLGTPRGVRIESLPPAVDLTPTLGPVLNQLELGSCTANAIDGALMHLQRTQAPFAAPRMPKTSQALMPARSEEVTSDFFAEQDYLREQEAFHFVVPSRLFIYWCERSLENSINDDAGAMLRDGIKSVNKWGAPPETDWPYDISRFRERPPQQAWNNALQHTAVEYARVTQTLPQMMAVLAAGYPFVFGFTVYESMPEAPDGNVPMPSPREQPLGGHAVLCCGYDYQRQVFHFRNSWSEQWGNRGNGTMPFAMLQSTQIAGDLWVLKRAT